MTVKIKPKRGSGSPAGNLETNEIAMETSAKKLYVSTDGTNAIVLAENIVNNTTSDLTEGTNLYYTDARVDSHLNQSNPTAGYVLSWSGSDYAWVDNGEYTNFNSDFDTRLATKDTADLAEGTNLYYTDARADARVNLQTGSNLDLSSKDTNDLSEGSNNLYYTDARVEAVSINELSEDSSPQLGGDLELDNNFIQNDGNDVLEVDNGALKLYHDGDLQITTGQYETTFEKDVVSTGVFVTSEGYESRILRFNPGYPNPSLTVGSQGRSLGDDEDATGILEDEEYEIISTGTTDFTDMGADDNNPGTVFTANRDGDTGDGTGVVALSEIDATDIAMDFTIFKDGFFTSNKVATPMQISTYHNGVDDNRGYVWLSNTEVGDDEDATNILEDIEYEIISSGDTDFTDFGADDNNPGTRFVANRDGDGGDGTGVVAEVTNAFTRAIEFRNDGGSIETRLQGDVNVLDQISQPLKIDIGDQNRNLENITVMDPGNRNNHDMILNTIDFEDYTPTDDTEYKQNFNFKVEGDEIPNSGNYQVGRIEVGYVHNEPLKHYIRLNIEDEQQEGQNYVEVSPKQVLVNAPFQFAKINSGSSDPGSPNEGDYFFNTSSKQLKLYTGSTPAWTDISEDGQQFYDNTEDRMLVRIDSTWRSLSSSVV